MSIIAKPISTKYFTFVKATGNFAGEISELPQDIFEQIYDDACDVGFYLVSEKTGEKILYSLYYTQRNEENEVESWLFKPCRFDKKHMHLANMKVVVFND